MNQKQYGASLGGPIVRESHVLFRQCRAAAARSDRPRHRVAGQRDTRSTHGWPSIGYPGAPVTTGDLSQPGRLDEFPRQSRSSARRARSVQRPLQPVRRHVATIRAAPAASTRRRPRPDLDNIDQSVAFSNTLTLSPRTVNETRAQFAYGDLEAPPTDPIGPAVSIAGVASFGTLSGSPTRRVNKMFEVVDNLSHQAGAHALRAGVDFLFNDDTITYPRSIRGAYTFSSLANFLSGTYNNAGFTQTFGATVVAQTNPNLGIYAQDEWKRQLRA